MRTSTHHWAAVAVLSSTLALAVHATLILPGETKTNTIAGQMDPYEFVANVGDTMTILMSRSSGTLYPQVELHAPDGTLVARAQGSESATIWTQRVAQAGTCLIVCRDYFGTRTGDYAVSLVKNPGPNVGDPEGGEIQPGETKTGTIAVGDLDAFSFAAGAGDAVTILMARNSGTLYPQVELHAPDGTLVARAQGSESATIWTQRVAQAGTCLIVCRDYFGTRTGDYAVSLVKNPGPNVGDPEGGTIRQREGKTGTITLGDLDAFSFTASAGAAVTIEMSRSSGTLYPQVELHAPDGTLVARAQGSESATIWTQRVAQAGTCLIVCRDYFGTRTGKYVVSFACVGCPPDDAPTITGQPQSQTVNPGTTVNFSVTASGAEPLRYLWRFNGTDLSNGGQISGATTTNLTILNVQSRNSGGYSVVVTNDYGAVTSSPPARLTVSARPTAVVSGSATICEGTSTTIQAVLTGTGQWNLTWSDGTNQTVSASTAVRVVNPTTNTTYTVTSLSDAYFTASPEDLSGSAVVQVLVPPAILVQPEGRTVSPGTNLCFTVSASGSEPLTYCWRFKGTNIANATNATFCLSDVQLSDEGGYDVIVASTCGSVTSLVGTLVVLDPSVVIVPGIVNTADKGASPDVHWRITSAPSQAGLAVPMSAIKVDWAISLADAGFPYWQQRDYGTWGPGSPGGYTNNDSGWISFNRYGGPSTWSGDAPSGDYTFELPFDLTGLDPSTAVIRGRWWSDNTSQTFVNGYLFGSLTDHPQNPGAEFTVPVDQLHPGTNTLTFVVNNQAVSVGTVGLRVDFSQATAKTNGAPVIKTPSPLPAGAVGEAYSQLLEATGGSPPYTWAVVSGGLPPGLSLVTNTGTISGTPTAASTNTFRVEVTDAARQSGEKEFSLTVQPASPAFVAIHSTTNCLSPGTNTVVCKVTYPAGRQLYLLIWTPQLPAGWTLLTASGDGNPEVSAGDIVFTAFSLNSPLNFSYTVAIPAGQTGTHLIRGTVTYLMSGMPDVATTMATPDPLSVVPIRYHSADYRDARWFIDNEEVSWPLAYWRAQAHHLETNLRDGYFVEPGNTNGPRHSADYRPPYWRIDGSEVNRVLAYWRAGGYHVDPAGFDGYAPGRLGASLALMDSPPQDGPQESSPEVIVTHGGPDIYVPGNTFFVTNLVQYSQPLLSLLVRPHLPSGWTVQSVVGDGNPEAVAGEIVWTGVIPPSPIQMVYAVQVPAGERAPVPVRGEVEYQTAGMVNPAVCYAAPDPLTLGTGKIVSVTARSGQLEFDVVGEPGASYRIQTSTNLLDWEDVTTVTIGSSPAHVSQNLSDPQRFYRAWRVAP